MGIACSEERFLGDVASHQLKIVRDDGLHRHLEFRKPGTYCYGFDIITWPGWLCYCGDMGTFVFSRLPDMFEFFRGRDARGDGDGRLHINLGYWAEKCRAGDRGRGDGIKEYSPERFETVVRERLDDMQADPALREDVERDVIACAHDGEYSAIDAAMRFERDGECVFPDFYERDVREYTFHFVWCCYALVWAIEKYDTWKAEQPEITSTTDVIARVLKREETADAEPPLRSLPPGHPDLKKSAVIYRIKGTISQSGKVYAAAKVMCERLNNGWKPVQKSMTIGVKG